MENLIVAGRTAIECIAGALCHFIRFGDAAFIPFEPDRLFRIHAENPAIGLRARDEQVPLRHPARIALLNTQEAPQATAAVMQLLGLDVREAVRE